MPRSYVPLVTASLLSLTLAGPVLAQQPPHTPITRDHALTGSIIVDLQSLRSRNADDLYTIKLNAADYVSFDGTARRKPGTSIEYNVQLLAHNPSNVSQTRHVGQLKGVVAINSEGRYLMRGSDRVRIDPNQRLMIAMLVTPQGMAQNNPYDGEIQGRVPKSSGWLDRLRSAVVQVTEYTRTVGGRTITLSVENPDIMVFENIQLGAGPWPELTTVTVNGNLDYDYASGNWLTNGISMRYNQDGQTVEDRITGTIRWLDEEGSVTLNGQPQTYTGFYEFNLRFNETQFASDAASAFFDDSASDDDVFFGQDNRIPSLLGRVYFNDSNPITRDGEEVATRSEVYYDLSANQLTPVQLVNFTKLWLLGIGPVHDD